MGRRTRKVKIMADAFGTMLEVDNSLVRKWGRVLVAVQDYSEPVPTEFFSETTGEPILPATAKQLGFITTDGVTLGKAITSEETTMLQWLEPVRSDLTGITKTLACAFGEASNAYVHAVYNGVQVADFPASADGAFIFDGGEMAVFPYYRVWLIAADGVGDQTRYRIEYGYRAKVTSVTDRTLARANPETLGFTFGFYKDPVVGKDTTTAENGPQFVVTGP